MDVAAGWKTRASEFHSAIPNSKTEVTDHHMISAEVQLHNSEAEERQEKAEIIRYRSCWQGSPTALTWTIRLASIHAPSAWPWPLLDIHFFTNTCSTQNSNRIMVFGVTKHLPCESALWPLAFKLRMLPTSLIYGPVVHSSLHCCPLVYPFSSTFFLQRGRLVNNLSAISLSFKASVWKQKAVSI